MEKIFNNGTFTAQCSHINSIGHYYDIMIYGFKGLFWPLFMNMAVFLGFLQNTL